MCAVGFGRNSASANGTINGYGLNGNFSGVGPGGGQFLGAILANVNPPPTLIWNPQGGSTDASNKANWYDQTVSKQGVTAPTANNPLIFDGTFSAQSNSQINWGTGGVVESITVRNGYNKLMSIPANSKVEDKGSLDMDSTSTLNVNFGSQSSLWVDGGGNITNLTLGGDQTGTLFIWGGTIQLGLSANYNDLLGANFAVGGGADVIDWGYTLLKFNNNNLTITVSGQMNFFYGGFLIAGEHAAASRD